jgi:thiol-disulfide isomerase/thioredoxin
MRKIRKWSAGCLLGLLILGLMVSATAAAAPAKTVMYFYGSTCPACKEVAPIIEMMIAKGIPLEKYEMYDNRENMDRLAMLFKLNGIPEHQWAVPVAFYNGQVYMGIPRILELEKELADSPGAAAGSLSTPDIAGIMGAALADSVNPCAILVLVILLSFISLYHESRKRLIVSAASFIASVFITYVLVGIGIVKALTFLGITEIVRNGIGILAIVVGILNLKDFFKPGVRFCFRYSENQPHPGLLSPWAALLH